MQRLWPVVPRSACAKLRVECSYQMYLAYSVLLALGLLISLPYWLFRMWRSNKYRGGLSERLGRVPARLGATTTPSIWVHAVSVGEVLAISRLVSELRLRFAGYRVFVSTTTGTGQKLAREKFGAENVFYFPLDFAFAIRPYLQAIQPRLVVLAETEFWPNFLRLVNSSGAKTAVVNARISDRSWPGYRRWKYLLGRILANVDLFLAQTDEDRKRLLDIGAPSERVEISGNLKFDTAPPLPPPIVASLRAAFEKSGAGPVIVAGSTMEGEESLLLRSFEIVRGSHPQAVLILAPRRPERFDEAAALVKSLGVPCWRRSLWSGEDLGGSVLLLDSIGELAAIYALASVAFVGGSLIEHGGHNILEPAQYGVPVLVGPHYENFREIVNLFRWKDAVRVVGPAELPLCMVDLLSNETERAELGRRALETVSSQTGATQRTLDALARLLPKA
jgi:3-deoxy-D-manno-octulosonic-acid transferase